MTKLIFKIKVTWPATWWSWLLSIPDRSLFGASGSWKLSPLKITPSHVHQRCWTRLQTPTENIQGVSLCIMRFIWLTKHVPTVPFLYDLSRLFRVKRTRFPPSRCSCFVCISRWGSGDGRYIVYVIPKCSTASCLRAESSSGSGTPQCVLGPLDRFNRTECHSKAN